MHFMRRVSAGADTDERSHAERGNEWNDSQTASSQAFYVTSEDNTMNRLPMFAKTLSCIFFLCLPMTFVLAQQSMFDVETPIQGNVEASLAVVNRLTSKGKLTADEIVLVYFAEKNIGKCVWGGSVSDSGLYGSQQSVAHNYFSDASVSQQCLLYVQRNRTRFRVVGDGWKGEGNFWEPTLYWVNQAKKDYPNSMQAMEIEFDCEFKDFIRQFHIDDEAKGKSCQQYFEEEFIANLDMYLDAYSKEEIDQWPCECESVREEFIRGRSQLLERYKNAPFTKVLHDIDPSTIVVIYSVC